MRIRTGQNTCSGFLRLKREPPSYQKTDVEFHKRRVGQANGNKRNDVVSCKKSNRVQWEEKKERYTQITVDTRK